MVYKTAKDDRTSYALYNVGLIVTCVTKPADEAYSTRSGWRWSVSGPFSLLDDDECLVSVRNDD
jgi:hypothetical protein